MQLKRPTISVIVPVYNVSDYIGACIESIVSQSYDSFELILVNDGSSDDSGEVCDRYSAMYDNIVVIHQPNGGVSTARNRGIDAACGEWIAFVDGDDELCEGALKSAAAILESSVDCYVFDSLRYNGDGELLRVYNFSDTLNGTTLSAQDLLYKHKYTRSAIWGCLYRTEFIRRADLRFLRGVINSQDTIFFAFAHHYADKMHLRHIDFVKVNYREGSASRSWNIDRVERYASYFKLIEDELKRRGIEYKDNGIFHNLTCCLISYLSIHMSTIKSVRYREIMRSIYSTSLFPIKARGVVAPRFHIMLLNSSPRLYAELFHFLQRLKRFIR